MRCYICNAVIDNPQFNPDHNQYDPCEPCLLAIEDTLAGYTDKPAAEEDFGGIDPIYEELYPQSYDPFHEES